MVFAMTTTAEPKGQQTTITTTIEQEGPGRVTFTDLMMFVHSCSDSSIAGDTPVRIEQDSRYDAEAREVVYEGWKLTATGTTTLANRP